MSNTFGIDDKELEKALADLESGKSIELGGVTYIKPAEATPLCDEHYFEDAGMDSEFIQAAKCKNCINGRLVDIRIEHLVDGKISSLE